MAKQVLIIDDDPDFRDAVSTLLTAKGYDVITAADSTDGFEKAKQAQPNLILLDVMMTDKTEGFNASRQIKSAPETKDIPVVMVTGVRKEMNLAFGFEPDEEWLPVRAVLEKPVKPEELLKTVADNIRE